MIHSVCVILQDDNHFVNDWKGNQTIAAALSRAGAFFRVQFVAKRMRSLLDETR
jgi:hypothetical protein